MDADIPTPRTDGTSTGDSGIDTGPDDGDNRSQQSRRNARVPVDEKTRVDISVRQKNGDIKTLLDEQNSPTQRRTFRRAAGRKQPRGHWEHQ